MSSFPLSGTVSKAPLLVTPAVAHDKDLLHYLKFKLFDAGFIIVREEYRLVNAELAERLCVTLDSAYSSYAAVKPAAPLGYAAESALTAADDGSEGADASAPLSAAGTAPATAAAADMVGNVYLFVLAHRDCHTKLLKFLHVLRTEDEDLRAMLTADAGDYAAGLVGAPLWTNTTAGGARHAVALLFPQMIAEDVPTSAQSREYVQANLKTALLPALTDLAKAKPQEPLRWLAERLLTTNTQAPPMMRQDEMSG